VKKWLASLFVMCLLFSVSALAQSVTFQYLSNPQGNTWANYSLSADGKTMAANLGGEIYLWTLAGGFTDLGTGDFLNSNIGISADGSTITSTRVGSDGLTNASLWKQGTGWIDLGIPRNGCSIDNNWSDGWSLNADGTVAVGLAWYCTGRAEGFRWTAKKGMASLGHPIDASSRATAISADGSTIVGFWESPQQGFRRAIRWAGGKRDMFAGINTPGEATALTSDGSQIVGQAWNGTTPAAFYFTDATGVISLGTLSKNPYDESIANSISDTGVVVGWSGDPFGGGIKAFIWDTKHPKANMHYLRDVLNRAGANIPSNIYLTTALTISADGSTIVGSWFDVKTFQQGTWMARFQ